MEPVEFHGPDHPFDIIGMDLLQRSGIHPAKLLHQGLSTFFGFCQLLQLVPKGIFRFFGKIDIIQQRLDIKSGAPNDDGHMSPVQDLLYLLSCQPLELHHIKGFLRIQDVDEVMGDTLHFLRADLRRTDIHPAVNLHGIRGNDFPR